MIKDIINYEKEVFFSIQEEILFVKNKIDFYQKIVENPICCDACTGITKAILQEYRNIQYDLNKRY